MKDKIKKIILFITNPRLLLCIGIAWMITNGWSYVLLGVGTFLDIGWMAAVSAAYITFLWFPFTPEKILTVIIAIVLLKLLFPKDKRTLGILLELHGRLMIKKTKYNEKRKKRKNETSAKENGGE